MRQLQGLLLPPLPQKNPSLLRRKPLLEDPYRLPGLPVLRLDQRERQPLHLPRFRWLRVLRKSTFLTALLPAAGLGVLVGTFARGASGAGWIFALLVCSAVVTALAQQTLP
jgi:hypothetical protein